MFTILKNGNELPEFGDEILKRLEEIFKKNPDDFEDFLTISENYSLIKEKFLEIVKNENEKNIDCAIFSLADVFHSLGADLMKQFSLNDDDECKVAATQCYKLSAKINPLLLPAYISLATIYGSFNGDAKTAIHYCDLGIKMFSKMPKNVSDTSTDLLDMLIKLKNDPLGGAPYAIGVLK